MQPAAHLVNITETKLDDAGTAARLRRLRRELIEPTIGQNGGIIRQTA